jgi:hypothetical protein
MKHSLSLLTLYIITTSSQITHAKPFLTQFLGPIEKQIFFKEVERIGKKAALRQIKETKDSKLDTRDDRCHLTLFPCFTLITHVNPQEKDAFSQLVVKTIKEKEEKKGYIPEHIEKITPNGVQVTMPNNFIENYTRYWHKKNHQNIPYIELLSSFTDKKVLLDVLRNEE